MSIQHTIWSEKYRPSSLTEMSLNESYRKNFQAYIDNGNFPHLLFHGPQGSGKTTMALMLINSIPCVALKLNAASADRGIDTMRGKVKQFAASSTVDGRLKIILMDEADAVTTPAQEALKNTIEAYSKTCRFIFTANSIDRIIGPIQSRCSMYEFSAFPIEQAIFHGGSILDKEGVNYDEASLRKIVEQYYPDSRAIVNSLQSCSLGGFLNEETISRSTIDKPLLLDYLANGELNQIRNMLVGVSTFGDLYKFLDESLTAAELSTEEKLSCFKAIVEASKWDNQVANRELNFAGCCVDLMAILGCQSITFR